jgi:hypothetical protein
VSGIIGFREKDPEPSSMRSFAEVDRAERERLERLPRIGAEELELVEDRLAFERRTGRGWRVVAWTKADVVLELDSGPTFARPAEVDRKEWERARKAQATEERQRRQALRQARRQLTLAEATGRPNLPTLRQAFELVVAAEGVVQERNGRLVVEVAPGGGTPYGVDAMNDCVVRPLRRRRDGVGVAP